MLTYYLSTASTATNGVYYVNYPLQYVREPTKQELEWLERQRRIERIRQWREGRRQRRLLKVREITLTIALTGINDQTEREKIWNEIVYGD